jgi:cell division protein FtsB
MLRLFRRPTSAGPEPDAPGARGPEPVVVAPTPAAAGALGSLADLPVAGLTRRRIALLIAALVAAWVIVLFARQVGEASEATARADAMRGTNAELASEVAALEGELALIQKQAYISQAARQYRLGKPHEVPFVLADNAPALADDAPGSALVRLGTTVERPSPLDAWARLLFGEPQGGAETAPGG